MNPPKYAKSISRLTPSQAKASICEARGANSAVLKNSQLQSRSHDGPSGGLAFITAAAALRCGAPPLGIIKVNFENVKLRKSRVKSAGARANENS